MHEEGELTTGHEAMQDVEMQHQIGHHAHGMEDEVKKHLEEAERNKLLNAQLQKEKNIQAQQQLFNNQLQEKLDQTQTAHEDEEKKHQEFLKKRKDHYKNELKAAMMLKQQIDDEDDDNQ